MVERVESRAVQHEARRYERGHEKSHAGKSRGHGHATERREDVRTKNTQIAEPAARTTRAHGALRRLQEGHFQGMSDLRLRINFRQEIERIEVEAARERVDTAAADLLRDVRGEIEGAQSDGTITSGASGDVQRLHGEFEFTATRFVASYDAADAYGFNELTTRLEQAFDTLVTALRDVLAAFGAEAPDDAAPSGTDFRLRFTTQTTSLSGSFASGSARTEVPHRTPSENVEAAPADEAPLASSGLESFFARLSATFEAALSVLGDAASQRLFPELSLPNGNGGSYEHFVSVYRESYELSIVFERGGATETGGAAPVDNDDVARVDHDDDDDDDDVEVESRDDAVAGGNEPVEPEEPDAPTRRESVFVSV